MKMSKRASMERTDWLCSQRPACAALGGAPQQYGHSRVRTLPNLASRPAPYLIACREKPPRSRELRGRSRVGPFPSCALPGPTRRSFPAHFELSPSSSRAATTRAPAAPPTAPSRRSRPCVAPVLPCRTCATIHSLARVVPVLGVREKDVLTIRVRRHVFALAHVGKRIADSSRARVARRYVVSSAVHPWTCVWGEGPRALEQTVS